MFDEVLRRGAQVLATQQVASPPDSLLLLDSPEAGVDAGQEGAGTGSIFLHIGASRAARPRVMLRHCLIDCGYAGLVIMCLASDRQERP